MIEKRVNRWGRGRIARPPASEQRSVLIVDDQEDERAIQRVMLEHFGYHVAEATDGPDALSMAQAMTPDLVLLDVAMPRMDGIEVCRRLLGDPRTSAAVILFYTASSSAEVANGARAAGGKGVLVKPLEPRRVAAEVRRLIGPARK
jgi:CheY-like chemotaxis protein